MQPGDPHYEFDNNVIPSRNGHPPPSATPKSLFSHVPLTSTESPGTTPKVPLLPPTPKQSKYVRLQNSPKTQPGQKQDTRSHFTSPLSRVLRQPVPKTKPPRPKSHAVEQPHYEVADGRQTLPPQYTSARNKKPLLQQLKKTSRKQPPISHHYEVADGNGTTPPDDGIVYATPTIHVHGKVSLQSYR